jgi:hypothetical protein
MEMDSMINVGEVMGHEVLNNTARRFPREDAIGPLAMPSVVTVIVMLLLTNTILLPKETEKTFTGKETIYSAHMTSDNNLHCHFHCVPMSTKLL